MKKKTPSGTLYIVATPIGNLEDISRRAVRVLGQVDLIACEDTRHTRKLLSHLGIRNVALTSYYREREQRKTAKLIEKLRNGLEIALVSDAGTPAVSDPGAFLVRAAREKGLKVEAIPGPSALITAVAAAGLTENSFYFGGFLPSARGTRTKFLRRLVRLDCALVFYESPRRIKKSLQDCLEVFGNREALLFKELTKIHERCFAGTLAGIIDQLDDNIRGEHVLIIRAAPETGKERPDNLAELLAWHRDRGLSLKDAVRTVSEDLDLPRNLVYKEALDLWKSSS
jgi:16S rRNA (cytidine1402-2'-O)-methyltransferase